MSNSTIGLDQKLREYLLANSLKENKVLKNLRNETLKLSEYEMQISPEQGSLLAFLVNILNAKRTLDIGVFTGYSSLVVALALSEGGIVTACDTNVDWTDIAQK